MRPDIGLCAQLACVWEVTARKPGNVHRYRDFADVTYLDFVVSAAAIAPPLARAAQQRPGQTILECVRATRRLTRTNTNLGIILLLAPLASLRPEVDLRSGVHRILTDLDVEDARLAYEAIRLANPGGLAISSQQDVAGEPTCSLREAMALAADRDLVARQYVNEFQHVFDVVTPELSEWLRRTESLEGAIVGTHLAMLSQFPDTLIKRKCGAPLAQEASVRARRVLTADWPETESSWRELRAFDDWLRSDGNRRNPGTTADLITAGLFVALKNEEIPADARFAWPHRYNLRF
jgi:triphosphoribosyl-dephospho-CoA synthase